MNLHARLLGLLSETGKSIWISIIGFILVGLTILLQAFLASQVLSQVFVAGAGLQEVLPIMLGFLGGILLRGLIQFLAEGFAASGAISIKTRLRERIIDNLVALGPAFTESKLSGDLSVIAIQAIESLEAYYSQFLPQVILAITLPLLILVTVFPIDLLTAIIFLLTAPLIPLFMYLVGSTASKLTKRQFDSLQRLSSYLLDTFRHIPTIKALGLSQGTLEKVKIASDRYRHTTLQVLRMTFLSALVLELVATIATAVVAVEIGLRLLAGNLEFSQAIFILLIAPEFYLPMRQLGQRYHAAAAGLSAASKIFEVLDAAPVDIPEAAPGNVMHFPQSIEQISFEDVSLRYRNRDLESLNRVNLTLRRGEWTVLVGPSGSGKSSLVKLLLKFENPHNGRMFVDGISSDSWRTSEWWKLVSWVPQQPTIINDTLKANILIGNPDAEPARIDQAIELSGLKPLVDRLPKGLETEIGEEGQGLSGGERQRLSLARAYLKNAPVWIMDEPAAHQDPVFQQKIIENIESLNKDVIMLVVAHSQETASRAKQIIVLEQGKVVEAGTHTDLLKKKGVYARMFVSRELLA